MPQKQPPTLASAYEIYTLDAKSRRVTSETLRTYNDRIKPFIDWCNAQNVTAITDLTATHIRTYLISLQERNLSSYTVNGAARAIRAWLNFCVDEGLLPDSPMRRVSIPKLERKLPNALSVEDAQKLLAACDNDRNEAVLLFLLDTGLRAAEFCKLDGRDIDMNSGTVLVRQGKGQKDRTVYIGNRAKKQLLRYFLTRGTPGDNEPVWLAERSQERLTTSGLRQILDRLGKKAGVHCHPHLIRRTFAVFSLRSGMTIYHLQRLMGHTDIGVLRSYLALVENDAQEAHQKFGAVDNML